MSVNRKIASDSFKTTVATFGMQAVAFVVSIMVAQYFGATVRTDAYFLALAVPALFTAALFGALKAVFVPVYTDYTTRKPKEVKSLLGSVYLLVTLLSICVAIILYILAPYFVPKMASGLDPEGRILALQLSRELIPLVVLTSLVGLMGSIYNAHQRFIIPVLAPFVRSLVLIYFILFLKESLNIHALSYGTVVGEIFHVFILGAALKWRGIYVGFKSSIHPAVKRMIRLSIPPITGNLILEFNPMVDKIMIASTAVGSVTALNIAVRWNDIPLMLLSSGGFMSVILAYWSKMKADKDIREVTKSLEQSLGMVTFILAPFLVSFFVFRLPIIQFFYERKAFTTEAVSQVASLWGILIFGVLPLLLGRILVRVYHVMQDTTTPFWIGISRTVLNVIFNFWFKSLFGLAGIALSTSVTAILLTTVNFYLLKRKISAFRISSLVVTWIKIAGAAVPAGVMMHLLYPYTRLLLPPFNISSYELAVPVSIGIASFLGATLYLVLSIVMKLSEAKTAVETFSSFPPFKYFIRK